MMGEDEYAVLSVAVAPCRLPMALTAAEHAVAQLVLRGLSNSEIARRRHTSPRTVANQLAAIFRKLGVNSRAELTSVCARPPHGR